MSAPPEVVDLLRTARRVLLCSHIPPDGDGLGSALALVRHFRSTGVEAVFASGGAVPDSLRFLVEGDEVEESPGGPGGPFDLAISLDSGSLFRLGPLGALCRASPALLNIDHHVTNTRFGTVNWVDGDASSTGELVHRLLTRAGAEITPEIALPLYTALVTDTGRFAHSNTTPTALRMAADLVEAGVRPAEVADHLYRSRSPAFLRLTAVSLGSLETLLEGRVAHVTATPEMVRDSGADPLDVGDLVDLPMSLAGVEVAVLFRRASDGPGTKVSFRSRRWFPVERFASRWGGGGHARAAGATVPSPIEAARRLVLAELLAAFTEAEEERA